MWDRGRVRKQIVVGSAADDLTQNIDIADCGCEGEVEPLARMVSADHANGSPGGMPRRYGLCGASAPTSRSIVLVTSFVYDSSMSCVSRLDTSEWWLASRADDDVTLDVTIVQRRQEGLEVRHDRHQGTFRRRPLASAASRWSACERSPPRL